MRVMEGAKPALNLRELEDRLLRRVGTLLALVLGGAGTGSLATYAAVSGGEPPAAPQTTVPPGAPCRCEEPQQTLQTVDACRLAADYARAAAVAGGVEDSELEDLAAKILSSPP